LKINPRSYIEIFERGFIFYCKSIARNDTKNYLCLAAARRFIFVMPPSTGGQEGIFAVIGAASSSNCIDPCPSCRIPTKSGRDDIYHFYIDALWFTKVGFLMQKEGRE
jgi:hypothetical protein